MSKRQVMESSAANSNASPQDEKRKRILDCALEVVLRYGYQRMTMDDVAKACGMSRPALYLQFKNKGEIYRAIGVDILARTLESARQALEGEGGIEARVFAAVKTGILDPTEMMLATPHGSELLDMKHRLAGDLIKDWHAQKAAMLAQAFEASGTVKAKGLTGLQLAHILLDGLDGLKLRATTAQERLNGAKALVRLVAGS
jgi:AcrR family transcriptional regulator